ncbi:MAG: hypothetical protein J5I91_07935 [Bacteroidetes bacterium]|nr:hypothetical protein [Bacteroidota bacterium]
MKQSNFILLFWILIFGTKSIYSQRISYKIIEDAPNKHIIHLQFGGLVETDFRSNSNRTGYYVTGIVKLHKRMSIGGDFSWGTSKGNSKISGNAYNVLDKYLIDLNGRASFFFSAKTIKENIKVTLSSNTYQGYGYSVTHEKYIYAPARKQTLVGFTGSAGYYQNNILDSKKDSLFSFVNKASNVPATINNAATFFNGLRFTGGLQISTMRNFEIEARDVSNNISYGTRTNRMRTDVYIEGIFMPVIEYSKDITAKQENGGEDFYMNTTPKIQNFGYRIRVDTYSTGIVGVGLRLEFGQKPGIQYLVGKNKYKNLYFVAGLMLGLNG